MIWKLLLAIAIVAMALTPDYAIPSEVWEMSGDKWDVRVCAITVYFAGPLAIEDRSDCGLEMAIVVR